MKSNKLLYLSVFSSIIFIIPILLIPSFGPIDDWRLLEFKQYNLFEIFQKSYESMLVSKRFIVYGIVDQYLITKISFTPEFYYSILFLIALTGLFAVYLIPSKLIARNLAYVFIPFIFLSITFTDNFYRTAPAEKYSILFIPFFLFYFYNFLNNHKTKNFLLVIVFSNLAIYQKEIIFTQFFFFAFFYIFFIYTSPNFKIKYKLTLLNVGIIVSCFLFLLIYYVFVYLKSESGIGFNNFYETNLQSKFYLAFQIYWGYMFKVPILTIFVPIILVVRFIFSNEILEYFQCRDKLKLVQFYDSLLISSYAFLILVCFSGQGVYGRYLFSGLLFSIFPLIEYIYFIFNFVKERYLKHGIILIIVFGVVNSSIRGVEWGVWHKIEEYSFQNTLSFIKNELKHKDKLRIYLADRDPAASAEIYMSYGWFLQKQDLISRSKFDLFSIQVPKRDLNSDWWSHNPNKKAFVIITYDYELANYTALQSLTYHKPLKGDIIIISANNHNRISTLRQLSDLKISVRKIYPRKPIMIYYPNPISYSVIFGEKSFIKTFHLDNDIYIVN